LADEDVYEHMRNLVYFTIGHNLSYIELLKLCINSLYKNGYDDNILIVSRYDKEIVQKIKFNKDPIFVRLKADNLFKSSANKFKIYLYDRIYEYDKVLYCDADMLWLKDPNILFDLITDDKVYVCYDNGNMADEYWGGGLLTPAETQQIKEDNINGINAGLFAFKSKLVDHFKHMDKYMNDNQHYANVCLEQPFFNAYLYRNRLYDSTFSHYVRQNAYHVLSCDNVLAHFSGSPGAFDTKYEHMNNYLRHNNLDE
jgi:lipopolysaccharide biosynthesis glycosyltransferase